MERYMWTPRVVSLLLLQCLVILPLLADQGEQFRNRVNLALRQTGHHLLLEREDTTSNIPPVQYKGEDVYLLLLANSFNYDTLPVMLAQAFADYGITEPYELVVQNCELDIPLLGYNKAAFERGNIPCMRRAGIVDCGNILVQFQRETPAAVQQKSALAWILLPVFAGLGLFYYRRLGQDPEDHQPRGGLILGQFQYDPQKQVLANSETEITLTFRENKLLHFLATHPNEVLNRADIMAAVWEEEGVIVGRSLDVFISRLRKLLKPDSSVQIKTIHGVGYRLELA